MRAASLVLASFVVLTLFAPAALAQDASSDDERARLHFEAGRSYYEEGNYEGALAEFQRSYALSSRVVLLLSIANCQERLGLWAEAADSLDPFVASLPEGEERVTLHRRVENLRVRAAERASAAQADDANDANDATTSDATATTSSTPDTAGSDGLLVPSLVAFGVGAAGLIAWGTLGGLALAEESSVADGCGATRSCTPEQVQAMDDLALGADIAMAVGLVGVATGAILLLADPPRGGSESASLQVLPTGGRHGAGLLVRGSF